MGEITQDSASKTELIRMTADVVASYVGHNPLPTAQIGDVISVVYGSLNTLDARVAEKAEPLVPAVPIRRSVTPDYIVCLEDGRKLKMLKRHLRSTYGMAPEEYRAKWGLPSDYPMVAPNYAMQRSEFAKKIGLGRKPKRARKGKK